MSEFRWIVSTKSGDHKTDEPSAKFLGHQLDLSRANQLEPKIEFYPVEKELEKLDALSHIYYTEH